MGSVAVNLQQASTKLVVTGVVVAVVTMAFFAQRHAGRHPVGGPTLGRPAGIFGISGSGWGEVRPREFSNGGDPTGHVRDIQWSEWGGPRAIGLGTGFVPAPDGVADGTFKQTTVVAFDLGRCHGKLMYRAVEWYYPDLGEKFDPKQYEDICKGDYVGD